MSIFIDKKKLLTSDLIPSYVFNLWDNTMDFSGSNWLSDSNVTTSNLTDNFMNKTVLKTAAWDEISQNIYGYKGETYTLSCNVLVDDSSKTVLHFYSNVKGNDGYSDIRTDSENQTIANLPSKQWIRISQTFKVTKDTVLQPRWENVNTSNVYFGSFMLNRGSIPLPWNVSLNDLKSKLGGVKPSYRLYYAISLKEVA